MTLLRLLARFVLIFSVSGVAAPPLVCLGHSDVEGMRASVTTAGLTLSRAIRPIDAPIVNRLVTRSDAGRRHLHTPLGTLTARMELVQPCSTAAAVSCATGGASSVSRTSAPLRGPPTAI